jgi:preprotein translocase subunit SecE
MTSPVRFFREVKQEGQKVTWPSRREVITTTIVVFIMIFIMAMILLAADWTIASVIEYILGRPQPGA